MYCTLYSTYCIHLWVDITSVTRIHTYIYCSIIASGIDVNIMFNMEELTEVMGVLFEVSIIAKKTVNTCYVEEQEPIPPIISQN